MTPTELSELDRLLAERVMGWTLANRGRGSGWFGEDRIAKFYDWQWHPTTDIAQAMMVAEKIGDMNLCTGTQSYACFHNGPMWQAETPTLAICLAAQAWIEARRYE